MCSFFALAFGISWGGVLVVMGARGFDLLDLRPLDTGLIFVLMLLGPSVSGLSLTALLEGRAGFHRLRAGAAHWRVGLRWYLVALMTMPLLLIATLWPLRIFLDPAFSLRFQWPLFAIGLVAGSFEEVGWTGFAAPRLLHRQRLLVPACGWVSCGHSGMGWLTFARTLLRWAASGCWSSRSSMSGP